MKITGIILSTILCLASVTASAQTDEDFANIRALEADLSGYMEQYDSLKEEARDIYKDILTEYQKIYDINNPPEGTTKEVMFSLFGCSVESNMIEVGVRAKEVENKMLEIGAMYEGIQQKIQVFTFKGLIVDVGYAIDLIAEIAGLETTITGYRAQSQGMTQQIFAWHNVHQDTIRAYCEKSNGSST